MNGFELYIPTGFELYIPTVLKISRKDSRLIFSNTFFKLKSIKNRKI